MADAPKPASRSDTVAELLRYARCDGAGTHVSVPRELLERAAAVSERRDSERLDYLAKTLHIDATGDQPVYALFIPGTGGLKSKADLRGLIDESIALSERD